ncbi:MAG: esterase/lipase family protein [Candidatus Thorarchaeota archaeon]
MKIPIKAILQIQLILILVLLFSFYNRIELAKGKTISSHHNPILFVHGWNRDSSDFAPMIDWFKSDGWTSTALYANNFDDRSNCSVQTNINNANRIKQWVTDILAETGAKKIDIVGHSMGGLNSRYYIKFLGGTDYVDDYVSLGSPQHGENVAACGEQGVNDLAVILNEGDETPGGILSDIVGPRVDPFSGIIYNGTHIPGNISYTSIFSKADVIPYVSPPLDGGDNVEVEGLTHFQLYQSESVYTIVKDAVDDTRETTTNDTTSWTFLPILIALFPIIWIKRELRRLSS